MPAIRHVDMRVKEGEYVALVGQNGSGKSTLGKLLNALLLPDEGDVFIRGLNTRDPANHAAIRGLVGMIFQRPQDQIVATTVEEDVAFGPGNLGLPAGQIRERVAASLFAAGLAGFEKRPSYMLSAGETQRLALAGVLAMRPKCLIFDETTAMLDPAGREMVLCQAKELHRMGMTVVFITHLMEEAAQADRILVLHKGRLVMDGSPMQVFSSRNELITIGLDQPPATILGNLLSRMIPQIPENLLDINDLVLAIPPYKSNGQAAPLPVRKMKTNKKIIDVKGLKHVYLRGTPLAHSSLKGVDFHVREGQIHGLIGATGSGKSTLLQHLNGLIFPQSGKIVVLGKDLAGENPDLKDLRRSVGLVFQQPENQIFEQYVGDEVAFAARNFGIAGKISDIVRHAMHAVGLDFKDYKDRFTAGLSGGEQRKVALASVLAGRPRILLLDEPLAGLDPRSRDEISSSLRALNEKGATLVISTHQLEGTVDMMREISVLADGKDVFHGDPLSVFVRAEAVSIPGIQAPLPIQVAREFIKKGWPVVPGAASSDALIQSLKDLLQRN